MDSTGQRAAIMKLRCALPFEGNGNAADVGVQLNACANLLRRAIPFEGNGNPTNLLLPDNYVSGVETRYPV